MSEPNDMGIDAIARRAAAEALADVDRHLDVDAEWGRFLARADTADNVVDLRRRARPARPASRTWTVAATAAAAVVAVVIGTSMLLGNDTPRRLTPVSQPPTPTATEPGGTIAGGTAPAATSVTTPGSTTPEQLLADLGARQLMIRVTGGVDVWTPAGRTGVSIPGQGFAQVVDGLIAVNSATGTEASTTRTAVFDPTKGSRVCDVEGGAYRIQRASAGGWVASVERNSGLGAVPTFDVDCATGQATAIDPVRTQLDGGGTVRFQAGTRLFNSSYDAEGNAAITSDAGVDIDGADYAGYHTFNPDASRVAYGKMDSLISPHYTDVLRARDTATGTLLWETKLAGMLRAMWWVGDTLVVQISEDPNDPEATPTALIVADAATGRQLRKIATTLPVMWIDATGQLGSPEITKAPATSATSPQTRPTEVTRQPGGTSAPTVPSAARCVASTSLTINDHRGNPRPEVVLLQLRLEAMGFDVGELDGYFGQNTMAALIAESRANEVRPTGDLNTDEGIVGPLTLQRLGIACSTPMQTSAKCTEIGGILGFDQQLRRAEVAMIQLAVRRAGFDPGTIDGYFGKNTVAGIKALLTARHPELVGQINTTTGATSRRVLEALDVICQR